MTERSVKCHPHIGRETLLVPHKCYIMSVLCDTADIKPIIHFRVTKIHQHLHVFGHTELFKMIVGVLTTCQFGTNPIIVLMFVESQRVHIYSTCKVCNKKLFY